MADEPQSQPAVATPYLAQQPDGSTATFVLHSNRQPTRGEVEDYATAHGHQFAGFPEPPAPPAPAAPPPAPGAAPAPAPLAALGGPDMPERAAVGSPAVRRVEEVMFPKRTFWSQAPSIGGAVTGGMGGAALTAPFAPLAGPFAPLVPVVGGLVGAGLGAMGGEAVQYGSEQVGLVPVAEPGTFGQRMGAAGIRGVGGEVLSAPVRLAAGAAEVAVRPVAEAAGRLEPILTGTAETVAPKAAGAAAQVSPKALLAQWWQQNAAGKAPAQIVEAWNAMQPERQLQLAGEHLDDMQTIMATIARGAEPWVGPVGRTGTLGAAQSYLLGGPHALTAGALAPAAYDIATQAPPKLMSMAVRTPQAVPWLASLPRYADVAGPIFSVPMRVGGQAVSAEESPPATRLLP